MKQIRILGAGLSGLTAAINLAKEGYDVKVFEKNSDCGKRFDEDFQGLENWTTEKDVLEDLKSMNIKINFYHEPFYKGVLYAPCLNKVNFSSKRPIFYLVKRGIKKDCLDVSLKKRAIKLGVNIEFNKKMKKDVDIIATGPKRISGVVRGITFKTKEKSKCAMMILDDNIAPKGYVYLLINGKNGTIASFIKKNIKNSNSYFQMTMKKITKLVDLEMKEIKHFSGYGNCFLLDNYEINGKLIVGEAAGLQDNIFGFGMRYAVTSGYLAAKSIIEKKSYDKMIKRRFEHQLKSSIANRIVFEKLGNRGYNYFTKKVKLSSPVDFLNKRYNYSLTKRVIYTFYRFVRKNKPPSDRRYLF